MPAIATGPEPSHMRISPVSSFLSMLSRVRKIDGLTGYPDFDPFLADPVIIKGMKGLAYLKHDIISHIDNGIDRSHAAPGLCSGSSSTEIV